MPGQLQNVVDSLARRLDRAVAIDDRYGRLACYSRHEDNVDEVRKASILTRQAPPAAWEWGLKHVAEDTRTTRVAGKPDIGMQPRVVAPVRQQDQVLGYLWVLDPDQTLEDDQLGAVAAAADAAGVIMYREQLLSELELGRERELLRDLVAAAPDLHDHAAGELVEGNLFVPSGGVVVVVLKPVAGPGAVIDESARLALGRVLDGARRVLSPRQRLHLVRPDHGLLVAVPSDGALPADGVSGFARHLRDELLSSLRPTGEWEVYAGVGDTQAALPQTATSYEHARQAVRVAEIVRSFGPVVAWEGLGIYQMLCQLPVDRLVGEILHPGLKPLLERDATEQLAETLECYLDLAGDAKATAATLSLHRATLYYRLHKIEDLCGASLRRGEDRLALHLGLKLARLAGVWPVTGTESSTRPRRTRAVARTADPAGGASDAGAVAGA